MRKVPLTLVAGLLLAGCDSGPTGPGSYAGRIQTPGPVLGGAVVEVVGQGISSFSGSSGTQVYWAPRGGTADTYRVVVVQGDGGPLEFQVAVQDLGAPKPRATLIDLVSDSDVPLPVTDEFKVRFRR